MFQHFSYDLGNNGLVSGQFSQSSLPWIPSQNGVYVITNPFEVIYVGKGNLHDRCLAHLNGDNPCILRKQPTQFWYKISFDMDAEEIKYIQMLSPTCNQRLG